MAAAKQKTTQEEFELIQNVEGVAFDEMNLHRVEAACLPHNEASKGVLRKCGFRYEGLAQRYLKINGKWRDHMQFALLREEFYPDLGGV